ncbi:MAG: LacI family DNA-binding transcriptional regulator [Chloroflexota bacterium]
MHRDATPPVTDGHSGRPARPTIRDVARHAGVAVSTVSHALSGRRHVSAATVARIQAAIGELDYHPNALAQAMITGRSQTLGLVLPDIVNPFFAHVARGAEDLARDRDYSLILCNSDLRPTSELRDIETLLAHQVDGILFIPGSTSAHDALDRLVRSGAPYVLMDEALPGPDSPGVFSDNEDGAYQAGCHLIGVGARSLVFIGGPRELPTVREKEAGFRRALAEHGIEPVGSRYGRYRTDAGFDMVRGLVEQGTRFDGLFAADDLLALGATQALQEAGLRVPEEVAVCGFDGMPGAELWTPALTTVAQRIYELGATGVRLLADLIEGRIAAIPRVVVPVELVVRDSTRGHLASAYQ